ncbi:serine/threonine-protein kinase [Kitasatospora sp. MAP5-34]|uniref:serine/threonine-protein kinase n=1 Tax=Kitasatospora sp. MAP5-34 TaxID=3035102 RepID=UPI002476993F|nr:serine/threonine-protein kinase [Kitasatospora sp. MAP5-34]MDH6574887.1 serine/threonine protein kinase [Kitasatospora sp. MAP5-34]
MSSHDDEVPPEGGRLLAGRYLLGASLGSGGMGTVWLARDQMLDREVAVKELSVSGVPDSELPGLHSRMQQEARAAARVKHPSVITVHDVLEQDGRPWIVMELIDGRSLAEVVATEGTLLPRDAARVGAQVVSALDAAHRLGVLHRDVKPANVLLERGGRVVLTDFGIAMLEGSPGLTRTGDIVGSPDYIAPERVMGHRPGPESDLWSLGATLYAAVEGQSPFHRTTTMSTLQAVITDPLPPPRNAGLLTPVIEALLRKDPAERPTAGQALALLQEVATARTSGTALHAPTEAADAGLSATPTRSTPPTPLPVPVPLSGPPQGPPSGPPSTPTPVPFQAGAGDDGRRRTWLVLVAAVLGVLLVGGVVFAVVNSNSHKGTPATVTAPLQSGSPAPVTVTATPTPTPTPASTPTQTPTPTPTPTPPPAPAATQTVTAAPAGYSWTDDPAGFRFAVPQGWTRSVTNGQIDYSPDGGVHLLRFGLTPGATQSSQSHFLQLEQTVGTLPDYSRITLQADTYQGRDGALWEFTWTDSGLGPRHAADQAFIAVNGTEYAIYVGSPAQDWPTAQQQFSTVLGTFTVS